MIIGTNSSLLARRWQGVHLEVNIRSTIKSARWRILSAAQQHKESHRATVHVETAAASPPAGIITGQHFVPNPSPSLDPGIFGEVAPGDKVRQLGVQALTIAKQQGEAARHGSRQVHSDPTLSAPEKYRRAHDISAAALMPAAE
jgi:hypothetical protein